MAFWNRRDDRGAGEDRMPAVREQRDPSAATANVSRYQTPNTAMVPEWNADDAIRWAYYANVIIYRCAQILANTVASLPFRAGADPNRPEDHDPSCRLAQLLGPAPGGPAPKLSARRLWAWSVVQRRITGRHAWEIELAPSTEEVVALWPLVSSQLKPVPSTGGAEWWKGFEYGEKPNAKTLSTDRVLYGWDPSATDFRQPESCLQAARLDVSIAVMLGRYEYGFLRNDARPASVVVTEAFASDDEYRSFKGGWNNEFGGPDNAGKTAFIETKENGAKPSEALNVHVLGLSQRDARFIEQHKASLELCAIAMGVPWSKLSAAQRTFDNATQEDGNFWEGTMLPILTDFADEVNMQLAPRLGREVGWFDLSKVKALQTDPVVQRVGAPALVQARIATINEGRRMVALPPMAGADRLLTDEELAVLQGRVLPLEAPATTPPVAIESAPPEPLALPAAAAAPAVEARVVEVEGRVADEDPEVRRARLWATADATVRTLERRWERAWQRLFARQAKAVLARLEGNRGRRAITEQRALGDEIFDRAHWIAESSEEAAALYEAVAAGSLARLSDLFAVSFDLEAEWVQDFIGARANQLAGVVTQTTYDAITAALAEGVADGDGIPALAERVKHVFDVASTSRATTIARTEVISAYNGAAVAGAAQLPGDVAAGQEWISTADGRTREDHAAADGQVVAIGEPFSVGGEQLAYPGDPAADPANIVNCRCTVAFLTPEEMPAGRSRLTPEFAAALLGLVRTGTPVDELALRRAARAVPTYRNGPVPAPRPAVIVPATAAVNGSTLVLTMQPSSA